MKNVCENCMGNVLFQELNINIKSLVSKELFTFIVITIGFDVNSHIPELAYTILLEICQ
jgi:hypothetical protein